MKKLCYLVLCLFVFWTAIISPSVAYAGQDDTNVDRFIDSYLTYKGYSSIEEMLGIERSGADLDVAFCLRRYVDGLDFSQIEKGIDPSKYTAQSKEKQLFYKKAFGGNVVGDPVAARVGLIANVFALHLLKNGISIEGVSKEEMVEEILSRRLSDGGWAIMGQVADVDVTAMCLQSLYGECDDTVMEEGITLLSARQRSDGAFVSYGTVNCESCAQVIILLSAMGIDCATDSRFVKENSLLDALLSFRTEKGVFSHERESERSIDGPTAQALSALVAYDLYKKGGGAFYSLPEYNYGTSVVIKPENAAHKLPINAWVAVGLAGATIVVCGVILLVKKGGWKEVVVIVLVGCGLSLFIGLSTFQTVDEYYSTTLKEEGPMVVELVIRKDRVDPDYPIIFDGEVGIREGGNVMDAVLVATRKERIQLSYVTGYISSIDNLAEFDHGNESGWMFAVNGVFSERSVSEKYLSAGDKVVFLYSLDMGKDVAVYLEATDE